MSPSGNDQANRARTAALADVRFQVKVSGGPAGITPSDAGSDRNADRSRTGAANVIDLPSKPQNSDDSQMHSIHFLCRKSLNLHHVGGGEYESGTWDVSEAEAQQLVGGSLYLHQTKSEKSYFGGTIKSFRVQETDNARSRRIVFRVKSLAEAKGVAWRGASHGMASKSGVLTD